MYEIIVIGASAGGTEALAKIFSSLPIKINIPIAIVKHISNKTEKGLISYFNSYCKVPINFAEDGEKIKSNRIYIAPPDYHMLLDFNKTISLNLDSKTLFSRPSIDELFYSTANLYQKNTLAVILTGSNSDGTMGAQYIKNKGGFVLAQDLQSCKHTYMPKSVIDSKFYDAIMDLSQIAAFISHQTVLSKN